MKKFKTLLSNLQEAEQSFGGTVFNGFSEAPPISAHSDRGVHYAFKDAEQLVRINAVINSYLMGTYVDPKEPLKQLSVKLAAAGLDLVLSNDTMIAPGPNVINVRVFGEKFGTTIHTDLTKDGFDTGSDYPDMKLAFTLTQNSGGYAFSDIQLASSIASCCGKGELGREENNVAPGSNDPALTVNIPTQQNESYITEEIKDPTRVVELFLSKKHDISKRILQPIYHSLESLKKRGKYTEETAMTRFKYAVSSGIRSLKSVGKKIDLSDKEVERAAKRLLHNYNQHIKSLED